MPNGNGSVADLSIQERAEPKNVEDYGGINVWFGSTDNVLIAPYWSPRREIDLRNFYHLESNDILQGAISSVVKKLKAMSWVLEGPEALDKDHPEPGTVNFHQPVLANAEYGQGWTVLLTKFLTDYLTQDKGAFIELIADGDPTEMVDGPILGLAHLDSAMCTLTGDVEFPVVFSNTKTGMSHKLHDSRVIHMADMVSPMEYLYGTGFCSVSRVISSSQILLKVNQYKNEKLSDLPEAGLLTLNNVMPSTFKDTTEKYQRERRRLGHEIWTNIMVLFGMDPAQPVVADFINFSTLPDQFNELETTNIYVNILALAFGVDAREFWPISGSPLGTAVETVVQHQKAKGKGIGDLVSSIERLINWKVLPSTVNFRFDFMDDEEDQLRAEINKTKIESIMEMWQPKDFAPSPVTPKEIRQMLANEVSYYKRDFLLEDSSTDAVLSDTSRVTLDSKGLFQRPLYQHTNRALQIAEERYRTGHISLDDLIEFRLGTLYESSKL